MTASMEYELVRNLKKLLVAKKQGVAVTHFKIHVLLVVWMSTGCPAGRCNCRSMIGGMAC